jgi:predicted metal-dependent hydrolase
MMRYLVRLDNNQAYAPKDVKNLQTKIRKLLGSNDKIGNLRVSTTAIELDLFAAPSDLGRTKSLLEGKISKVVTLRSLESRISTRAEDEVLREGIDLFNQERFWEAHEVLEEIWHPATGVDRDTIQGLILTAAALVHYQKNEKPVCVSILGRAKEKLGTLDQFKGLDIRSLRFSIKQILKNNTPMLIRIQWVRTKTPAPTL